MAKFKGTVVVNTDRCKGCEFEMSDGKCLVKVFAKNHKCNYPLEDFGSMGMH